MNFPEWLFQLNLRILNISFPEPRWYPSTDLSLIHFHRIDIREVFYHPQHEESINDKKLAEWEALRRNR